MIGIDTNILVRIFVTEGGHDEARARAFVAANAARGAFFVALIVLVELVWTLRSRYSYSHSVIAEVVRSLLGSDDFVVESRALVEEALTLQTTNNAGFADILVALCCRAAGSDRTYTLDKKAAKAIPSMELIP